jgi:hypothetical protein
MDTVVFLGKSHHDRGRGPRLGRWQGRKAAAKRAALQQHAYDSAHIRCVAENRGKFEPFPRLHRGGP